MFFCIPSLNIYAAEGELGYFGGISEGINLPKSIEKYVPEDRDNEDISLEYKEMIFITGEPIEVEGIMEIRQDDPIEEDEAGTYTTRYIIEAENLQEDVVLRRNITLETSYRRDVDYQEKVQIIRDTTVDRWTETITINGVRYTLEDDLSDFSKGSIEDQTPGVKYYNGEISYRAVYTYGNNGAGRVTVNMQGPLYGYDQPWSKVETQKLIMNIENTPEEEDGWQMEIELTPTIEAKKTIYFEENEPYAISFDGTYNQVMERHGGLDYRITTNHPELTTRQKVNSISIPSFNMTEKLRVPTGLDFLAGHFAEEDIKKLFSLEILTGTPSQYQPYQAMSRGGYIVAICKAMNIEPRPSIEENKGRDKILVFADLSEDDPNYGYYMEAYYQKLINGDSGYLRPERPLTREEAFVMLIRVIGLERLGLNPTPRTPFVDDDDIAMWAKNAIYAGNNLGLILGDNQGKVSPKKWVSKAEAAAVINRLIEYLREDIIDDYRAKIMY